MAARQISKVTSSLVCDSYSLNLLYNEAALVWQEQRHGYVYFKLLLWAVVCNRLNLADYFWRRDSK
ncbi:hypothetical protein U2060_14860 [Listeria monocytogenes]